MGEDREKAAEVAPVDSPVGDQINGAPNQAGIIKARPSIKDVLTVTLSILAFILSVGTVYFNILRTEESVSVIGSKEPIARLSSGDFSYIPPGEEGELIFINSGNRFVVIRSIVLSYTQPKATTKPSCPILSSVHFETDFAPTVLKPNDVIVSKVRITRSTRLETRNISATRRTDGALSFPLSSDNLSKAEVLIDICLSVYLSTPTTALQIARVPVHRYHSSLNAFSYDPKDRRELFGEPVALVRKTGTIFSR